MRRVTDIVTGILFDRLLIGKVKDLEVLVGTRDH